MNYIFKKFFSRNYFNSIDKTSISYVIFGLGNPEPEHKNQRHNIGKIFINDFLKQKNLSFSSNK